MPRALLRPAEPPSTRPPEKRPAPAPRRGRPFDSPEQEAFLNLWRTYDRLRALEEQLFARYDLTPQQYNVLRLLRGERPRPIATLSLARRLVSRAPDITRMIDKLEQRGLVRRDRPADNRRVVRVAITEAGLDLLRSSHAAVRRLHARQLGHLTRQQLRQLVALLRQARQPHEDPASSWR
jgi:DNA-binding MarR family transcriptional regulator